MKISIVGTGYVGLVTGTCLAEVGHEVTCIDIDEKKIKMLRSGISPIFEPGLENLIKRNTEHERLFFSSNLKEGIQNSQAIFIAVGTPQDKDGSADLRAVESVALQITEDMHTSSFIVIKSTVPVGTCASIENKINQALKKNGKKIQLSVSSNPEFLKEGAAIDDFMRPDRIVIGVSNKDEEDFFRELYSTFIQDSPAKLVVMDRASSELTKYASNAMLATRISFMNELSRLCEKVGANIDHIRLGMGTDPRIGRKFLYSGPGYGGSCFPKDVNALLNTAKSNDIKLKVLQSVTEANEDQKDFVTQKILQKLNPAKGKKVAVWGLTFKPGTDDVRDAPAIQICRELLKQGIEIIAHDPQGIENFKKVLGNESNISYVAKAYQALKGVNALVLITEWSEYKRPNWHKVNELMKEPIVFDLRNQYSVKELMQNKMEYFAVGRSV